MNDRSLALVAAAVTSVLVTVGLDIAVGADPVHVVVLGAFAVLVAAVRLRRPGHHRVVLAAFSGALVLPPALHLAREAAHAAGPHLDAAHGWPTTSVTALVGSVLAVALAAAIGAAEWSFDQLGRLLRRTVWLVARLTDVPRQPERQRPQFPDVRVPELRIRSGGAVLRGPPLSGRPASP